LKDQTWAEGSEGLSEELGCEADDPTNAAPAVERVEVESDCQDWQGRDGVTDLVWTELIKQTVVDARQAASWLYEQSRGQIYAAVAPHRNPMYGGLMLGTFWQVGDEPPNQQESVIVFGIPLASIMAKARELLMEYRAESES
jgi:hypothetical protein